MEDKSSTPFFLPRRAGSSGEGGVIRLKRPYPLCFIVLKRADLRVVGPFVALQVYQGMKALLGSFSCLYRGQSAEGEAGFRISGPDLWNDERTLLLAVLCLGCPEHFLSEI